MNILSMQKVTKKFFGLTAVEDVTLEVAKGEIIGLIGPNGAGKTTFFNCITGYYKNDDGKIVFKGQDISGLSPHKICKLGMARTFQIVKSFGNLTALENVMVGAFNRVKKYNEALKIAEECIEFVGLGPKKNEVANDMNIGDQRKLEMARALATKPEVLLLDEVMAGLTPTEIEGVIFLVRKIRDSGVTILMIEHIMAALMSLSDRVLVLDRGKTLSVGTPEMIVSDESVIASYLGRAYAAV